MRGAAVLCPRRSGRIRTLLCLRMSGAGVAFPVQIISLPCHSVSTLCCSGASPGNPVPMLCSALPLPCIPLPLPFCANPVHRGAWVGVASPMQILAYLCLSRTGLCFSGALRVQALPQPCGVLHIPCPAAPDFAVAMDVIAIPVRNVALLFRGISLLCTAPLCPH